MPLAPHRDNQADNAGMAGMRTAWSGTRRAGRGTNLGLLVLLAWALASGGLAFAVGLGWGRWIVLAHGVLGLGLLILAPWKSVVVRRGFRRDRARGPRPGSGASVVLGVLAVAAVASGVAHVTGLLRSVAGITMIQVHVASALACVPFGVWHVAARPVRPRRTDLSRRTLLRAGALAGGSLAVYGGMAGAVWAFGLPGRSRRFTGSYATGSGDPDAMPVTQWLNDGVPSIDPARWSLSTPAGRLGLQELEAMREPVTAVLDCTGGWYASQRWEGVRLDRLLPPGARSIVVRSATGYARRFPASDASRLWLATRADGRPLSAGHGFPARLVAPGRRGFWWVKWVVAVEPSQAPWWWQPPFPLT